MARGRGVALARQQAERKAPRRAAWLLGGVLVLALIVAVVVWLARQEPAAGPAGSLDQPAPGATLALPSTAGGTVTLAALQGKPVVLYFYEGST